MTAISNAAEQVPAAAPPVPRPDVNRKRMARLGWTFTAPALVIIGAVTIFPIVCSVVLSVFNVSVSGNGISLNNFTLSNYSLVLQSSKWHYALGFTVIYTLVTVIVAELWGYIYQGTYGVATALFGFHNVLGTSTPAIIGLMVADIWKTTPFVAILVLAGLVLLPWDIYEAAEVDGSSGWSTFWRITVPLLRPTLALAVMFRVLQAFGLFDLPYVLTNGGPGTATTSLAILGYNAIFKNLAYGPGAAVASTTALLVLLGCLLSLRTFRVQVGKEN